MGKSAIFSLCGDVAPFTGAWIEIYREDDNGDASVKSHPSRVRGLKYITISRPTGFQMVAPFTGAWIEIKGIVFVMGGLTRRTLHGCVD